MAIRFTKKFLTRIDLFTVSEAIMFGGKRGFDYGECEGFWPNSHLYNYNAKRDCKNCQILFIFVIIIHTTENYIMAQAAQGTASEN